MLVVALQVNNFLPYNTPVKERVHNIALQLPGERRAGRCNKGQQQQQPRQHMQAT